MEPASPPPRACVVYESMFGNTESAAAAVAQGLRDEGFDAAAVDVFLAPLCSPLDADLLVVGAPTHGFSISRPSTRQDAVRQGAQPARAATGVREWLATLESVRNDGARPVVAVFDTRVAKARRLPAAGRAIARKFQRNGLRVVPGREAFLVDDVRGPLQEGEVDHARAWGRSLAAALRRTPPRHPA